MLYFVCWKLPDWIVENATLAELSVEERKEIEDFLAKEEADGRISSWRVREAAIMSFENLRDIYQEDQRKAKEAGKPPWAD